MRPVRKKHEWNSNLNYTPQVPTSDALRCLCFEGVQSTNSSTRRHNTCNSVRSSIASSIFQDMSVARRKSLLRHHESLSTRGDILVVLAKHMPHRKIRVRCVSGIGQLVKKHVHEIVSLILRFEENEENR